jgi:hypothetical protein
MKHKVGELDGALLDMAVAMALGAKGLEIRSDVGDGEEWCYSAEPPPEENWGYGEWSHYFAPSTAWEMGGPIIERERIAVLCQSVLTRDAEPRHWLAKLAEDWWKDETAMSNGPTPLIAAMRAYVASKFGAEVDLPD